MAHPATAACAAAADDGAGAAAGAIPVRGACLERIERNLLRLAKLAEGLAGLPDEVDHLALLLRVLTPSEKGTPAAERRKGQLRRLSLRLHDGALVGTTCFVQSFETSPICCLTFPVSHSLLCLELCVEPFTLTSLGGLDRSYARSGHVDRLERPVSCHVHIHTCLSSRGRCRCRQGLGLRQLGGELLLLSWLGTGEPLSGGLKSSFRFRTIRLFASEHRLEVLCLCVSEHQEEVLLNGCGLLLGRYRARVRVPDARRVETTRVRHMRVHHVRVRHGFVRRRRLLLGALLVHLVHLLLVRLHRRRQGILGRACDRTNIRIPDLHSHRDALGQLRIDARVRRRERALPLLDG